MQILHTMNAAHRPGWRVGAIVVSVMIGIMVIVVTSGMMWLPATLLRGEFPREFDWSLDGLLIIVYLWGTAIAFSFILLLNNYTAMVYHIGTTGLRITLRNKKHVEIPFSQIEESYFRDTSLLASRSFWQKFIDPIGSIRPDQHNKVLQWLFPTLHKDTWMPLHLGLAAREGEIYVRKRSGIKFSRMYLPWWNNPWHARELSLTPEKPKEFFEKFQDALKTYGKEKV